MPSKSDVRTKPGRNNIQASPANRVAGLIDLIETTARETAMKRSALLEIKNAYKALARDEKTDFFSLFQERLEVKPEDLTPLLSQALEASSDLHRWPSTLTRLRGGLESPRWRLFRRFASLAGGLKFLLDFRADLLSVQSRGSMNLGPVDRDLVQLMESWFQDGFLYLEEITLDSPYRQIEIIKNGDMVHPMTSLEEMGRRLGRDRRCFALYHRAMSEEPVVFIEVALTRGVIRSIHEILDLDFEAEIDPGVKDTAVFYSINNTQNGLAGLGLGQILIFLVVDYLKQVAPQVKNFCTLSPMPGFWRRYLKPLLEERDVGFKMTAKRLEKLFDRKTVTLLRQEHAHLGGPEDAPLARVLLDVFSAARWAENETLVDYLSRPLTHLGYEYLAEEKDGAGRPLDPVANFHLGNGATLTPGNVNFGANWSVMGLERSLSLMVNYVYSQDWRRQIGASMSWLAGLLPGRARRRGDRPKPPPIPEA